MLKPKYIIVGLVAILIAGGIAIVNVGELPQPVKQATIAESPVATSRPDGAGVTGVLVLVATSRPGLAGVTGVLVRLSDHKPLKDSDVFLAEVITSTNGQLPVASLDPHTAPYSALDQSGRFVITNVPPKTYGVVLQTPTGDILLRYPMNAKDIVITLDKDQVIDLGEIPVSVDY